MVDIISNNKQSTCAMPLENFELIPCDKRGSQCESAIVQVMLATQVRKELGGQLLW